MTEMKTLTINGRTYTVNDPDSVSYGEAQNLTEEQKKQARGNIGAAAIDDTKAGDNAWSGTKTAYEISKVDDSASIICEAAGSVVSLSDASNRALAGLTLYGKTEQFTTTGKNLIPYPYIQTTKTENGVTITDNGDGSIKLNGTATADIWFVLCKADFGDSWAGGTSNNFTTNGYVFSLRNSVSGAMMMTYEGASTKNTFIKILSGAAFSNLTVYPQVELGTVATDWEPYTGGIPSPNPDYPQELVSVGDSGGIDTTVAGKNLLPFPYSSGSLTSNLGITFTYNADGSITFVGTATGAMYYWLKNDFTEATLPAGKYCLSATGLSNMNVQIETRKNGAYVNSILIGAGAFTVDYSRYDTIRVFLICNSGKTVNETIYPQIEVGSTPTAYEPYKAAQTLTVETPNGLPGIPVSSGGNYTDENGQQWICDEIDLARGVYGQNTKKLVLNGTQTPTLHGTLNGLTIFTVSDNDAQIPYVWGDKKGFFSHGIYFAANSPTQPCAFGMNNKRVHFALPTETVGTTVEEVKAYISAQYEAGTPLTVLYRLAEPVETALDAQTLADYATMHTNKPDTTAYNDAGTHMALSYVADTKTYIDNKFAELSAALVNNV